MPSATCAKVLDLALLGRRPPRELLCPPVGRPRPKGRYLMDSWHQDLQRRCTGTNRNGERCGRAPIVGGTVCVLHGGGIPAVQQAAKVRLLGMVEPVLATFEEILAIWNRTRCDKCGYPTGDPIPVIRVGQLVLDRAGFHPTLTVEHAPPPDKYDDATIDETIERLETLLAQARAIRDAERANVIEAVFDDVPEEEETLWSIPAGERANEPAKPLEDKKNE